MRTNNLRSSRVTKGVHLWNYCLVPRLWNLDSATIQFRQILLSTVDGRSAQSPLGFESETFVGRKAPGSVCSGQRCVAMAAANLPFLCAKFALHHSHL